MRIALVVSVCVHLLLFAWLATHHGTSLVPPSGPGRKRIDITLTKRRAAAPLNPSEAPPTQPEPPSKPVISAKSSAPRTHLRPPARVPKPSAKPKREKPLKTAPLIPFVDEFPELSHTYTRESLASSSAESSSDQGGAGKLGIFPGSIANINPKIVYPRRAIQQGHAGTVVVLIHIDTDGHTSAVDLLQSSGYAELDDQVLGAVQHWRFVPPRRGSMPVASTYKHTVVFTGDERVYDGFEAHWQQIRLMPAP